MNLKLLISFLFGLFSIIGYGQTTLTTSFTNNNGNSTVTLNFQNNNAFDVIITDVASITGLTGANTAQLWYKPGAITGLPGAISLANGWTQAASQPFTGVANTTTSVSQAMLVGISLTVPAGATYGLAFGCSSLRYSTLAAGTYNSPGGGCDLISGTNISYGGTAIPNAPTFTPRGFIGSVTFIAAVPCTAPPTAGSTVAATNPVCPSTNNTISLSGGTGGTGQTYQWQSSADGVTYGDIVGATNSTYNANQTAATYYQCIVTCSAMSSTTTPVFVTMNVFSNCYCNSIPGFNADEEIYNVTVNGGSTNPLYANAAGCATAAPGPGSLLGRYSNFKTLAPITSAAPGQTVTFSIVQDECDVAPYYNNGIAVWIDFNQNGLFTDPGEQVFVEAVTAIGPRTINGSFTIPGAAITGNTVMRIICAEGISGAGLTPCLSYNYGETEDHLINIACPTLAGVTSVNQGVCSGNAATLTGSVTNPLSTISWWDSASGGTQLGSGTSYTTPPLFANTSYWAQEDFSGCPSSARTQVDVTVTSVGVTLTPINVSCNGNNNGSFSQTAVACGTAPFTYSLDNGVTFGAIPTNLVAGTYFVIVQDATMSQSVPYQVIITQPAPPANLTLVDANYYTADISWTTTGNETSWDVEYGPAGFVLGTGTVVNVFTNFTTLTGLAADTDYQFYVTAVCGTNPVAGGPASFSTNAGFFTYDNACGPGFNDISATGVGQDLFDDNQFDFTLPWTWNYQGLSITTLSVDNNGGISFVAGAGIPFTNGTMAAAANGLYALWDDLYSNGGAVYTQVIGTTPNRQAIFQWNVDHISFDGDDFVFQIVIDEATNEIYYLYDNVVLGDPTYDYGANATIGAAGPMADPQVSFNNATYLQNNSCVHFYNALCPNAVVSTVTPFQEEVILDWNAGLYGETEWTLIYGPAGFDPLTSGTTITVNTSDANILGLSQLTDYDVYIYSECTLDNLTSGGLLVSFTTLPWCANPTTIGGTTAIDSLFSTWNFVPAVGAPQPLSSFNLQYGLFGFDLYNGTVEVATGLDYADTVANAAWLAGGVYQIYVQAVCGTDTSSYSGPYTFVMPITNDDVCMPEMLQVDGTVYTFNNTGATAQTGEAALITGSNPAGYNGTILPMMEWGSPAIEGSNWYTFVAPASGSMWFSGQDENFFASQIAIYEATNCADFTTFSLVAASDQTDLAVTTKLAPHFTVCGLTPGDTYYVLHDAWSNGFGGLPNFGQYSIKMTEIVLQAGSFADVINTCTGSTVNLFDGIAGYDNGGVWTAEIPAAGTGITDSMFNSSGLAYQIFNFEYRLTEGCAYDTIITQVDIYEPSTAGDDGTITVCRNEPYDLLSGLNGTADLGGTWYNPSNQPIASSAVTASNIPGQYNFIYIAGNGVCPDDSALVLVNVDAACNYLNVDEMFFATMTVMPNPSNGVFNVANTSSTEVFNFEVTDMEGRIILAKDAAINGSSTTEINLTGKVTGMYMIRVYNDNAEKTFRVILQ